MDDTSQNWYVDLDAKTKIGLGLGRLVWSQGQHNKEIEAKPLFALDTPKGTLFLKGPGDKAFLRREACDCGDTGCIGSGLMLGYVQTGPIFYVVNLGPRLQVWISPLDIREKSLEALHSFQAPVNMRNTRRA